MFSFFIEINFFDILDIIIVAILLYQVYLLIRGTVAVNIFTGLFLVYLLWLLVRALNMDLLGSILGQFIGLGVLALIIVFQQEIRRFLLMIGVRYSRSSILKGIPFFAEHTIEKSQIKEIARAIQHMSRSKTGALLVITKKTELTEYINTGLQVNAIISAPLLETVFFKNSPLHDGAVILSKGKLVAAKCILPITGNTELPENFGLRHRAAIGLTENADAYVIVISEETGKISFAKEGDIKYNIAMGELNLFLKEDFTSFKMNSHHK